MKPKLFIPVFAMSAVLIGCEKNESAPAGAPEEVHKHTPESGGGLDHGHAEVPLGTLKAGELELEATQGVDVVEAGKEGIIVIKLPYKDDGATVVRAWIGTEDRTLSTVGKGNYMAEHGDYDIHATAPDPLPEGAMWWIEVEKPDGTKLVGSITPKL
ncbi:hypothetical protein HAHE_23620 [Haloferula helveola]|uniref:Uncharacterized protein n=1 Tax=Haloferula helveola TaxID=490095 RepID=A0ABM7RAM1_9BACT|nr:hypothetical protein HAHE_23620 [Haloferula helveola]